MIRKQFLLIIVLVQLCMLTTYGQEKKLTFTLEKDYTKFVSVDSLNYDNFIVEVINTSRPEVKDFSIVEKNGRFDLKLIKKTENSVKYRVNPAKKNVGKHILTLLLKTKDTTEFLTQVFFFKDVIDLDSLKKDAIVELEHLSHPPRFKSNTMGISSYKFKRVGDKDATPISIFKSILHTLSYIKMGDYILYEDDKPILTIRIIPPLVLGRGHKMDTEIISHDFRNKDSLSIEVNYTERVNRINSHTGHINITIAENSFKFSHKFNDEFSHEFNDESQNLKRKSMTYKGVDKGIIAAVTALETKGKKTPLCMNTNFNGIVMGININGKETIFEFCTNNWDGLQEFIDKVAKMRTN